MSTSSAPSASSALSQSAGAAAVPAQKWDPSLYGARASFVHRMAADLVDLLAPRPGEHVLDLGCGPGDLTATIQAAGATVVGLDASAAMIDAARRRHGASGPAFVVGDGQALDYESAFDAVFSNAALHWMPRADAVARGVARALRPGGRFVAEFGGHGCIAQVRAGVSEALRRRGEDPAAWLQWYFPNVAEYVAVLAAAGFDVRFAHRFDRPTPVEGDDGLAAWLRTFLPRLEEKLGAEWPAFAREVEASCAPALLREVPDVRDVADVADVENVPGARDGARVWVLDYVRLRVVAGRP
jgi:trans-aconitate methyltransferase